MSLGVVSLCVDPDAGTVIGADMGAVLKDLGVTDAQISVRGDRHNHVPLDLYRRGVAQLHDAGISVHVRFDLDLNRPWLENHPGRTFYPNTALGYHGNDRLNQWVLDTCTRAYRVAQALPQVASWTVYNEPNLALTGTTRPVHIGENVPPVSDDKAPALAAEVWASLSSEMAGWLRHAGATQVVLGTLSWLPIGSAADIGWSGNAYCAGYLRRGLQYLRDTGVKALPFTAMSCNSEGSWSFDKALAMRRAITNTISGCGYADLPLVIGEWGSKASTTLGATKAITTYQALSSVAQRLHFYQAQLVGQWGAFGWSVAAQTMVPTAERTAWWDVLRGLTQQRPDAG